MKKIVKCNHCQKELSFEIDEDGNITRISEQGWVFGYTVNNETYLDLCPDCFKIIKLPMENYHKEFKEKCNNIFNDFVANCHSTSIPYTTGELVDKTKNFFNLYNKGIKT